MNAEIEIVPHSQKPGFVVRQAVSTYYKHRYFRLADHSFSDDCDGWVGAMYGDFNATVWPTIEAAKIGIMEAVLLR